MVKVQIPPQCHEPHTLFGGAYDGAFFLCGPGLPHVAPKQLVLHEEIEGDETTRVYSYGFAGYDSNGRGRYEFTGETSIPHADEFGPEFDGD